VRTFRLAGFVFLIIPGLGHLPQAFVTGGYGDIATGVLAIIAGMMLARKYSGATFWFVLFSVVGMGDLLNVAGLLFYFYPSWKQHRAIKRCLGGVFHRHGPGDRCPDRPDIASLRDQECLLSREDRIGGNRILYVIALSRACVFGGVG
jgi:hypothetical protein